MRSPWKRYLVPLVAVVLAAQFHRFAGDSYLASDFQYFCFAVIVLASSIAAGFGPGLLATAAATFLSASLWPQSPGRIPEGAGREAADLVLFFGEGLILSYIGDMIRYVGSDNTGASLNRRYAIPVLFVAGATGLKLIGWPEIEGRTLFALYLATAAISAWAGGFGSGVIAVVLAALCSRYFFMEPLHSFAMTSSMNNGRILLFLAGGTIVAVMAGRYVRTRRTAVDALERVRAHSSPWWRSGEEEGRAMHVIYRDILWEWEVPSTFGPERTGKEAGTLLGNTNFSKWLKRIHPKDRLKVLDSLKAALEQGHSAWYQEYRRMLPGQGYVHVSDSAVIIRDDHSTPTRVAGHSTPLIEANRGVDRLAKEGGYRALFENNPHAMLIADSRLRIVDANDAACEMLGYKKQALTKAALDDFFPRSSKGIQLGLTVEDPSSVVFVEDCITGSGEVFRARITAAILSGMYSLSDDRVITIEEITEEETHS